MIYASLNFNILDINRIIKNLSYINW